MTTTNSFGAPTRAGATLMPGSMSPVRFGWRALGPILTAVGVLLLLLSPAGYRLGLFGLRIALLDLIPLGVGVCALGLVVSLAAIVRPARGAGRSAWVAPLASVIVSIAAAIVPVLGIMHSKQVPAIHDISTDTDTPPAFVALAAARRTAPNGLEYGGAEVAAAQKRAYPDLVTLRSRLAPDALFDRAEKAVRDSGWQLVDANRGQWRIEATESTLLYGFKDDMVVQIRSDADGSRLDVRSASRIGHSDLGVNAARIRGFLRRLS